MRTFDAALARKLAEEATTFCRCWLIVRKDGVSLGFTDHDREILFDGVRFEPETGFARTEMERSLGLSVDNLEVAGALRSEAITEQDIADGLYDGAEVAQWLVDWTDPALRTKLSGGRAGEIRRGETSFEMEILGLAEQLNRPIGRVFQRLCDAELGDDRCRLALGASFRKAGVVASVQDGRRLVVAGDAGEVASGWFDRGSVEWISGANAGLRLPIRSQLRRGTASGGGALIELWRKPRGEVRPGDELTLVAGCDKTSGTCKAKFDNLLNFRGFPLMPGEDWLMSYPKSDQNHDGGSLFHG